MKPIIKKFDLLVVIVCTVFLFFRFFNLQNRIVFDWDQETLAYQMRNLILHHDIFLIGHRATDVKGFYFGPYYEYLQVPFFFLANLNPFALLYSIVTINIAFLMLAYFVVKKLFDQAIALGFIFIWAVNSTLISYDITMWAPIIIPIGMLGTYYLLSEIYNKGSLKNWIILGLWLGFFTQVHSLFFAVDLFAASFLTHLLMTKPKQREKLFTKVLLLGGSASLFTLPLVLFDLKHDFLNLRLVFEYFFHRTQGQVKFGESLQVFTNFMNPLIPFNNLYLTGLFYFTFLGLLIYQVRKAKGYHQSFYVASLVLWISTALVYLKFTQRPSEYYFLYLYPIMTLTLLKVVQTKMNRGILMLCIFILFVNAGRLSTATETYNRGLHEKMQTIQIVKRLVGNQKFNVAYDLPLGLATGYDYLFDYYHIPPSKNPKDPLVILRSPAQKGDIVISQLGIFIPSTLTNK